MNLQEVKNGCPNKKRNQFIKQKNEQYLFKVKVHSVSSIFIHGDPKHVHKASLVEFYNDLEEGTEVRLIFTLGKMYKIIGEY